MQSKKVLAVLEDLLFMVKINEAAKRAGMQAEFVKSQQDTLDKAAEQPAVIFLDLNFASIEPLDLIKRLKSDESTKKVNLIGFVSHVQGELKQQAQEAGCNTVLARSAFSQNLPLLLKRNGGAQ